MAQQHVGTVYAASTSVTLPAHQAGDLIVVAAVRFNSTTIPSLPAGFTSLHTSATTHGRRLGYKIAASSSETSGTWTNATTVVAAVYRGTEPAAVTSSTSNIPGLTLQRPDSWVWVYHCSSSPITPSGWTTRLDVSASDRMISDSAATLPSWAGVTTSTNFAFALELALIPDAKAGSDSATLSVTESASVSAVLAATGTATLSVAESAVTLASTSVRTDTATLSASGVAAISVIGSAADSTTLDVGAVATVRRMASRSGLVMPWDSPTREDWPVISRTAAWEQLMGARVRTIAGWGELVDANGRPLQVEVNGRARWRLPLSGASVDFDAEETLSFSAKLQFSDPWMIPRTADHPLWGASPALIRLWWAVWSPPAGVWWSKPLATLAIGDTAASDAGTISGTVSARDVLATAVGYGRGAPNVAGMTIDQAIAKILTQSAPALQVRITPTAVTVPDGTVLRDPLSDVEDLAAAGYPSGVVRSNDVGVAYVGPRPVSADAPLNWREGRGCPVSQVDWVHGVTAMGNRVTAVSTHPDAVGLVVTRDDDDPTSPTYVGGPWGVRPLPAVESSVASTLEALTSVADAALDRGLHPTEDVKLKVAQRPDLYGWRPAHVTRGQLGVGAVCQVASWSLQLPVPGVDPSPMDVGMMQRQV